MGVEQLGEEKMVEVPKSLLIRYLCLNFLLSYPHPHQGSTLGHREKDNLRDPNIFRFDFKIYDFPLNVRLSGMNLIENIQLGFQGDLILVKLHFFLQLLIPLGHLIISFFLGSSVGNASPSKLI